MFIIVASVESMFFWIIYMHYCLVVFACIKIISGLRWMLIGWADVEAAEWHRVLANNKTHFLTWSRDYIWVRLMDEFISRVMGSITTISLCILIVPEYSSHCIWILSSSLHSLFWDCQALLVWWERLDCLPRLLLSSVDFPYPVDCGLWTFLFLWTVVSGLFFSLCSFDQVVF